MLQFHSPGRKVVETVVSQTQTLEAVEPADIKFLQLVIAQIQPAQSIPPQRVQGLRVRKAIAIELQPLKPGHARHSVRQRDQLIAVEQQRVEVRKRTQKTIGALCGDPCTGQCQPLYPGECGRQIRQVARLQPHEIQYSPGIRSGTQQVVLPASIDERCRAAATLCRDQHSGCLDLADVEPAVQLANQHCAGLVQVIEPPFYLHVGQAFAAQARKILPGLIRTYERIEVA